MKEFKVLKITMLFLFVLCAISFIYVSIRYNYIKVKQENLIENIEKNLENTKQNEIEQKEEKETKYILNEGEIGLIIIPSIDVKAPVCEGTSSNVLKYAVGHFEETSQWSGNVALASHNRGSYAHYFSRINELESGEEIIYITNMGERRYEVTENKIIEETNVEILKNTKENIITLITCITEKRDKRRCIVGKEIY